MKKRKGHILVSMIIPAALIIVISVIGCLKFDKIAEKPNLYNYINEHGPNVPYAYVTSICEDVYAERRYASRRHGGHWYNIYCCTVSYTVDNIIYTKLVKTRDEKSVGDPVILCYEIGNPDNAGLDFIDIHDFSKDAFIAS